MPTYSLVLPAHNEEAVVDELVARLGAVMDQLDGSSEVILVDDGSRDRTYELMQGHARSDSRFRIVRLSRNFGHQTAISAGIDFATGDAVIILDADLQDPPEVILALAARWREGYDVVYAERDVREGETAFRRARARAFYRLLGSISDTQIPADVGDFRLVDRRALDVLAHMREGNRFLRGMFSWIGLRQTGVLYTRHERFAGDSKYPLRKLVRLGWSGVTSFSVAPLRAPLKLGLLLCFASVAFGIWSLIAKLAGLYGVPEWTVIVVVATFLAGMQLAVLGVIGEYLGDMHMELKQRPLYVVSELENVPDLPDLPPRTVVAEATEHERAHDR